MSFYKSIAQHYHHIFPLSLKQVEFVFSLKNNNSTLSVLDIGCGIGSLTHELSSGFKEIDGIDLDSAMIGRTKELALQSNRRFHTMNMLDAERKFGRNQFDLIFSFGNTLVHLKSEDEILTFFVSVRNMLRKEGIFSFQIINYDRIFAQNIQFLPTIENEHIQFIRNYFLHENENKIEFESILTVKQSNQTIKNKINLYALRKEKAEELLMKAGFSEIISYGNFNKEEYTMESMPLIIIAK